MAVLEHHEVRDVDDVADRAQPERVQAVAQPERRRPDPHAERQAGPVAGAARGVGDVDAHGAEAGVAALVARRAERQLEDRVALREAAPRSSADHARAGRRLAAARTACRTARRARAPGRCGRGSPARFGVSDELEHRVARVRAPRDRAPGAPRSCGSRTMMPDSSLPDSSSRSLQSMPRARRRRARAPRSRSRRAASRRAARARRGRRARARSARRTRPPVRPRRRTP